MLDDAIAHYAEHVKPEASRAGWIQHCKQAVDSVRNHAAIDSKLFVNYVVEVPSGRQIMDIVKPEDGEKPTDMMIYDTDSKSFTRCRARKMRSRFMLKVHAKDMISSPRGVAVALVERGSNALFVGGSFCNYLDTWNRHVGLWLAIQNMQPVPWQLAHQMKALPLDTELAHLLMSKHSTEKLKEKVPPPWDFVIQEGRTCAHTEFHWFEADKKPFTRIIQGRRKVCCPICEKPLSRPVFPPTTRTAIITTIQLATRCWDRRFGDKESTTNVSNNLSENGSPSKMVAGTPITEQRG